LDESKSSLNQKIKAYHLPQISLEKLFRKEGDSIAGEGVIMDAGPLINWDSWKVIGTTKTQQKYLQRADRNLNGTPHFLK